MPATGCRGADTRDAPGHQEAALAAAACSWFPVLEELPRWAEQSPRDLTPALLPSLTPPPRPPALGPGRGSSGARSRGHRLHPHRELSPPGLPFAEEAAPAGQRGPRAAPCHLPARAPLSWAGGTPLSHAAPDSAAHVWGCSRHSTNSLRSFSLNPPPILCLEIVQDFCAHRSVPSKPQITPMATGRPQPPGSWCLPPTILAGTRHRVGTTVVGDSSATATC